MSKRNATDAETSDLAKYEVRDASTMGVTIVLLCLGLFGVGLGAGLKTCFNRLKHKYHGEVAAPRRFNPPAPRLQVDESGDLHAYLAREQRLLSSYGKNQQGRHIPINRAMEILAHE